LHQQGRQKVDGFVAAALDDLGKAPALADQARCAGLLGAVVRDLEPLQYQVCDLRYPRLLEDVLGIFNAQRSRSIAIEVRIEAADALGQAGDPRLDPRNPERWVSIPACKFLMGAQKSERQGPNYEPEAGGDEAPVHEVHLDTYRIGRYPVTVGEFQRFLEDGGYTDRHWWGAGGFGQSDAPGNWADQLRFPNRPVVGVSWFEAAAYCVWAGCRLPTEAEWERAARGTEGRRFPWGNEPADPSRLNYSEGRVGHATPVGVYPLGATPGGIQDLAGNAWEWCQDWYAENYYAKSPPDNPTGPAMGERRVLRGGSWDSEAGDARSADRVRLTPDGRGIYVGFRVVAGVAPRTP
jgi:formylglycine-generating enzyme required for sulfatase activity